MFNNCYFLYGFVDLEEASDYECESSYDCKRGPQHDYEGGLGMTTNDHLMIPE